MRTGFLFAATLFTNLCLVAVNSRSLTTTWHAYNQDQVNTLSQDKACERYWNSSISKSSRNLGNDSSVLSEARLWPGNVSLLCSYRLRPQSPLKRQFIWTLNERSRIIRMGIRKRKIVRFRWGDGGEIHYWCSAVCTHYNTDALHCESFGSRNIFTKISKFLLKLL